MRHAANICLFLLALASATAWAEEKKQNGRMDYVRGYAQAILDREFAHLALTIRDGDKPGYVVLLSTSCPKPEDKEAVSHAMLGATIEKLDWEVACPAGPEEKATAAKPAAAPQEPEKPKVEVEPLPPGPIFRPLLADPREPRFSLSYQRQHGEQNTFNAAEVAAGADYPLAEGKYREGRYQAGIQGAVFALFNLDESSKDLINADYLVGIPLTWRHEDWSARVRLYHQSSHLGDEFILGNPGVDRINLSYEVLDGILSHEWQHLRLYGGGGVILHSDPDLDNGLAQFGAEYEMGTIYEGFDLTLAADLKGTGEQDWHVNQSYAAGVRFTQQLREVRLLLLHYRGFSPNGQFFTDRLYYTGFGLYFGF